MDRGVGSKGQKGGVRKTALKENRSAYVKDRITGR